MIKFNLPGLYEHHALNMYMIELYKTNPEVFRKHVKIESIFGNFPFCIWDGGRNFAYYKQATKEQVENIRRDYLNFNAKARFVFTNPELTEEDLDDRWCNLLLNIFNNTKEEIVINSDLMKNYLQKNYPDYNLVSSTTKCITNKEKALEEIMNPEYYQVCLDYNLNKDIEFLESIPKEYRHKVEFLCNAICPPGCAHRKMHYSETGLAHLTYLKEKYSVINHCHISEGVNHPSKIGCGNNLSWEEIEKYHQMGFQHFKLEGRTLESSTMFAQYLYYLIKPEYYFYVAESVVKSGALINDYNNPDIFEYKGAKEYSGVTY